MRKTTTPSVLSKCSLQVLQIQISRCVLLASAVEYWIGTRVVVANEAIVTW